LKVKLIQKNSSLKLSPIERNEEKKQPTVDYQAIMLERHGRAIKAENSVNSIEKI